jgi:hypothetical protein
MHWVDPDFLPDIKGSVERFVINPKGEIDGLVLIYANAKVLLVHVPPHLGSEVEAVIHPGDTIRVRGIRPRGADMIAAVALTAADGRAILDNGPGPETKKDEPHRAARSNDMTISGIVRLSLFGPKGELRGAVLNDGSFVRVDAKEAPRCVEWLRPRAAVAVRGDGLDTKHGRVVVAKEIGPDPSDLRPARGPKRLRDETKPSAVPADSTA